MKKDYSVKGTPLPKIPIGTRYGLGLDRTWELDVSLLSLFSGGTFFYNHDIYIIANTKHKLTYTYFLLSDIEALDAKESEGELIGWKIKDEFVDAASSICKADFRFGKNNIIAKGFEAARLKDNNVLELFCTPVCKPALIKAKDLELGQAMKVVGGEYDGKTVVKLGGFLLFTEDWLTLWAGLEVEGELLPSGTKIEITAK